MSFARSLLLAEKQMKVVGTKRLDAFRRKHSDASSQAAAWLNEVKAANWRTPQELKDRYPNASILPDNRVVFNIKGNCYRLEVKINYTTCTVAIRRIGSHAEYSRWE